MTKCETEGQTAPILTAGKSNRKGAKSSQSTFNNWKDTETNY